MKTKGASRLTQSPRLEFLDRHVERSRLIDARVINQQIDPSVLLFCLVHNRLYLFGIGDIHGMDRMSACG